MAGLLKGDFAGAERRPFADRGEALVLTLGDLVVLRARFEPGWRWSQHVRPLAGTPSCESPHRLYVLAGRMHVQMDDGTEVEFGAGDVARIDPGHDAWVVGDDVCELVDFGASPTYAQPSPAHAVPGAERTPLAQQAEEPTG